MEILYLLLPVSLLFVMMIAAVLWWAVFSGQYDDPEQSGHSILDDDDVSGPASGHTDTHLDAPRRD